MAEDEAFAGRRFTRRHLLLLLGALLALALLVAPWTSSSTSGPALSTYSADPAGARGLHDVLQRLGFPVQRRLRPLRDTLSRRAVYVLLDPPIPLTASELNTLLGAVRAGAALLIIPSPRLGQADSLGVVRQPAVPRRPPSGSRDSASLPEPAVPGTSTWLRWVLRRYPASGDSTQRFEPPADAVTFLSAETEKGRQPQIVGEAFGAGRMVLASDPDFFRNSVIRRGNAAERAVRLIEWLVAGDTSRPIIFDEYHHGFGAHADVVRTSFRALTHSGPGRMLLQLAFAGGLLLLTLAVRALRPRPLLRIERRSPLEHVDALARAYAAVHASERATRLLVRGLRRRHGGRRGPLDETVYLKQIGEQNPVVALDVQTLSRVLQGQAPESAAELAAAITRIEQTITS